jgi:hypothetical protein
MNRAELILKALLGEALAEPMSADLHALWIRILPMLAELPDAHQLRLAGFLILQLVELHELRADDFLGSLNQWLRGDVTAQDPVMDETFFTGLIQQTMYLDLSELVEQKPPRRRKAATGRSPESIAGQVDKQRLLEVLDLEQAKREALSVAHDENVSAWIERVAVWIMRQTRPEEQAVLFSEISQSLQKEDEKMTRVKVFLALLLGGYRMEQEGDFYTSDIQVFGSYSPLQNKV